jgi:hypothetical protein
MFIQDKQILLSQTPVLPYPVLGDVEETTIMEHLLYFKEQHKGI